MRAALRLLATASRNSTSQFLEPGAPTGLTGLLTHGAPRSALLYIYTDTLNKLKQFPESSVYRQSTEALTKHRLSIIESVKPAGLEEWQKRVQKVVDEYPQAFKKIPITTPSGAKEFNIVWKATAVQGMVTEEFDDEVPGKPQLEGPRTEEERKDLPAQLARDPVQEYRTIPRIEPEPPLTQAQVEEIEQRIAAGLIEEVIQVAEGESQLCDTLLEHKVWEELEEKPAPGQWSYFERRDTHVPTTQAR